MEAYVFENVLENTLHIQKYPDKCGEERINKYEREKSPVLPLTYVYFTKVTFRPILKSMKLIGSLFLERSKNFYSVLSRENSTARGH